MEKKARIEELKRRIERAENRITRVETIDDYLADMQIIQAATEEINKLEKL